MNCCAVLILPSLGVADGGATAESARAAIAQAATAIDEARDKRALWTTAEAGLREAESALVAGEYDAAVSAAQFAEQQARLGIEQLSYPRFPE